MRVVLGERLGSLGGLGKACAGVRVAGMCRNGTARGWAVGGAQGVGHRGKEGPAGRWAAGGAWPPGGRGPEMHCWGEVGRCACRKTAHEHVYARVRT